MHDARDSRRSTLTCNDRRSGLTRVPAYGRANVRRHYPREQRRTKEFPQFPQALRQSGRGAETLVTAASLRGVSAVSASDMPITAGLTSRRSRTRPALSGSYAALRRKPTCSDWCAFSARPSPSRRPSSRETWLAPRMRIQASTRRAFRRRLPAPPPIPRRVLDDRAVSVDSGSSVGHGDAPRCGSVAHVSHIGRIVKYYLCRLSE